MLYSFLVLHRMCWLWIIWIFVAVSLIMKSVVPILCLGGLFHVNSIKFASLLFTPKQKKLFKTWEFKSSGKWQCIAGLRFWVFERNVLPLSSVVQGQRLSRQEWHSVEFQKTWILKKMTVETSNLEYSKFQSAVSENEFLTNCTECCLWSIFSVILCVCNLMWPFL